jgi:hypothetical protein
MTPVDLVTLRLTWAEDVSLPWAPHLLRGAIGQRFPDNPLVHQHEGDKVVYRYPRIQYRWDRSGPWLLGLGEGARFLADTEWTGMGLTVGNHAVTVRDATCAFRRHEIRGTSRLRRYSFGAPWLPLSQDNYRKYQTLSRAAQRAELDRLAIAGLLLGMRGFGVEFRERLYAGFEMRTARSCSYKGVELLGFMGELLANVDLPDGFALGRAVSHGYGWLASGEQKRSDDSPIND